MDTKTWTIRKLLIKTGHRFSGKELNVPTSRQDRISYPDSTVYLELTKGAVELGSVPYAASIGVID